MKKEKVQLIFWLAAAILGCAVALKGCFFDNPQKNDIPDLVSETTSTTTEATINQNNTSAEGGMQSDSSSDIEQAQCTD